MLFSIIMPAYNAERFLAQSIESVLEQTYPNWELILINDGSVDGTETIAMEYAQTEPRIRYFRQENRGVSAARNKGIDLAAGEYVFFMDADDELDRNMLKTVFATLEETRCDIVTFNAYRINTESRITGKFTEPFSPQRLKLTTEEEKKIIYSILVSDRSFGLPWLFVVKREIISGIRFRTDMIICEDLLVTMQMYEHSDSIVCLPDYFYYYRDNPAGCVRNFNFRKIEDVKIAYREKIALAQKHQLQENMHIADMWFCLVIVSFYDSMLEDRNLCRAYLAKIKEDAFVMQMLSHQQAWSKDIPPKKLLTGNAAERAVLRAYYLLRRKAGKLLRQIK